MGKHEGASAITLNRSSVIKIVRTFLFAFAGILLPGLLGWLHALTEWASSQGQTPFPDAHSLAYVGVAAITAGAVAVVNAVVLLVEDSTGKGLGRDPSAE